MSVYKSQSNALDATPAVRSTSDSVFTPFEVNHTAKSHARMHFEDPNPKSRLRLSVKSFYNKGLDGDTSPPGLMTTMPSPSYQRALILIRIFEGESLPGLSSKMRQRCQGRFGHSLDGGNVMQCTTRFYCFRGSESVPRGLNKIIDK